MITITISSVYRIQNVEITTDSELLFEKYVQQNLIIQVNVDESVCFAVAQLYYNLYVDEKYFTDGHCSYIVHVITWSA